MYLVWGFNQKSEALLFTSGKYQEVVTFLDDNHLTNNDVLVVFQESC